MTKIVNSLKESYNEMVHKVSWPKFKELQSSSVLVLIGSIVFAVVIGLMDIAFDNVMAIVYETF